MNKKKEIKAYSGKYITHKGKLHILMPELKPCMCEGCDLYNMTCPPEITELCTKGFILKRVKA